MGSGFESWLPDVSLRGERWLKSSILLMSPCPVTSLEWKNPEWKYHTCRQWCHVPSRLEREVYARFQAWPSTKWAWAFDKLSSRNKLWEVSYRSWGGVHQGPHSYIRGRSLGTRKHFFVPLYSSINNTDSNKKQTDGTRRDETYRTAHHQNDSVETKELDWPFHDAMLHKGSAKSQQLLSAWEIQQNTYKHEAPNNSEHVNSLEAISFLQIKWQTSPIPFP